jgi:hypothetical protein
MTWTTITISWTKNSTQSTWLYSFIVKLYS